MEKGKKTNKTNKTAEEPRSFRQIFNDYLLNSDDALAVAYRKHMAKGSDTDTHQCVDVKTVLNSERSTRLLKSYNGTLTQDDEYHFIFIEELPEMRRRNVRVYNGHYFSLTRRSDGMLRLNFKPIRVDGAFCVKQYASGVSRELCIALTGFDHLTNDHLTNQVGEGGGFAGTKTREDLRKSSSGSDLGKKKGDLFNDPMAIGW